MLWIIIGIIVIILISETALFASEKLPHRRRKERNHGNNDQSKGPD